jgi:hypothetical protein
MKTVFNLANLVIILLLVLLIAIQGYGLYRDLYPAIPPSPEEEKNPVVAAVLKTVEDTDKWIDTAIDEFDEAVYDPDLAGIQQQQFRASEWLFIALVKLIRQQNDLLWLMVTTR